MLCVHLIDQQMEWIKVQIQIRNTLWQLKHTHTHTLVHINTNTNTQHTIYIH